MILTVLITPLELNKNLDNQSKIDYAIKEGKEPPKKKVWDEIRYQSKSMETVGGLELEVSSIEKMKSTCEFDFTMGKAYLVQVNLFAWSMNGKSGISSTIVSVVKKAD